MILRINVHLPFLILAAKYSNIMKIVYPAVEVVFMPTDFS